MSNEIKLILATHLAFYRRHPWLMGLFLLGFSLGSALLTAIAGLNQEAKSRYQASSALISSPVTHLVKPLIGEQYIEGDLWIKLRRQGITHAQPVLRGRLKTQNGHTVSIQGVDTLLWLNQGQNKTTGAVGNGQTAQFSLTNILIDQQFAKRLKNKDNTQVQLAIPKHIPQPNFSFAQDIGLWAITDLAYADALLGTQGKLSFIELAVQDTQELALIDSLLDGKAQLVDVKQQEFDVLSQAFFFNLAALAMLGYIVAAFLSFNAIKLTLTARKKLLDQMHVLGCTQTAIRSALGIELVALSLVTALIGTLGGYFIANTLVLDVNRTLIGLFELDKALTISWQWSNVALGLALNMASLAVILMVQTRFFAKQGKLLYTSLLASTLTALIWLINYSDSEFQALLLCFTILALFILVVPKALEKLVSVPLMFNNPLTQWLHADTRFHIKDLHIAIVAILVALGSAIGMQIMVHSFSKTLNAHLEKQLSADIFLTSQKLNLDLRTSLASHPDVAHLSIYIQSDGKVNSLPANLASFGSDHTHYQNISLVSGEPVSERHFESQGCLANEQSKIKYGLSAGTTVTFKQNAQNYTCRISDFFYDYGNQSMLFFTLENRQTAANLNTEFFGYSMHLSEQASLAKFTEILIKDFNQDSTHILPNQRLKQYANTLFNDTFVVTKALNGFILAIALLSLCTSLLSLSAKQLKQLAILRNLGVNQRQLLLMKLSQTTTVVLFTTLFAVPLGFALGFALLKFVMPIAFGWTIHFSLNLTSLIATCLVLIAVTVLCAYLPIRKLTRFEAKEL